MNNNKKNGWRKHCSTTFFFVCSISENKHPEEQAGETHGHGTIEAAKWNAS
jgi:hypothetical protein